jgi:hypothetical protein
MARRAVRAIVMLWTELELDRVIPDERLREAWAEVFGFGQNRVAIIDDFTDETARGERISLVAERRRQPGDFPLHLTIVLRTEGLAARVAAPQDSLAAVRALCRSLECHALLSDDGPNPYRWILVRPDAPETVVRVDPDRLDESGAFVLVPELATTEAAD